MGTFMYAKSMIVWNVNEKFFSIMMIMLYHKYTHAHPLIVCVCLALAQLNECRSSSSSRGSSPGGRNPPNKNALTETKTRRVRGEIHLVCTNTLSTETRARGQQREGSKGLSTAGLWEVFLREGGVAYTHWERANLSDFAFHYADELGLQLCCESFPSVRACVCV